MHIRIGNDWHKALRRIVRNPTFEVVAAMVVVMIAAWVLIETEAEPRATLFPLLVGHR